MICSNCENENAENTIFCHSCLSLLEDAVPLDCRGKNFDRLRMACSFIANDEIAKDDFIELLNELRELVIRNLGELRGAESASPETEKEIGLQRELTLNGMTLFLESLNMLYSYPESRDFKLLVEALSLAETGNTMLNEAIGIIREQEGIQGEGVLNLEL